MKLALSLFRETYRKVTDFYNVDSLIKGLKLKTLNNAEYSINSNIEEIIDPKYKRADGIRVNDLVQRFDKVLCTADFPYAAEKLMPSHSPVKNINLVKLKN